MCTGTQTNGQTVTYPCFNVIEQGDQPFIGMHYSSAWDFNCDYNYESSYWPVDSDPDSPALSHTIQLEGTAEIDDCDIDNSAGAMIDFSVGGKPFKYIPIFIDKDFEFNTPEGDKKVLKSGSIYVMPYCLADMIFRKVHDEQFSLTVSRSAFVFSLALAPFSGGASASAGLRILTLGDVFLSGIDALVMAPTQYELDLTGESTLPIAQEIIDDWNQVLAIWGAANVTWLIKQGGTGLIKFSLRNGRAVIDNIRQTASSIQQFRENGNVFLTLYTSMYLRMKTLTVANADMLSYVRAQNAALRLTYQLEFPNSSSYENILIKVQRQMPSSANSPGSSAQVFIDHFETLRLGKLNPIGEVNSKLIPDNWAPSTIDTDPNYAFVGTLRNTTYQAEDGVTITGNLSIYKKFGGGYYVKAGDVINDVWVNANHNLLDFYILFNQTRNWGTKWDNLAAFINTLDTEDQIKLLGFLNGDSFIGTAGDDIIELIRIDITTSPSFKDFLKADIRRFDATAIARRNLDVDATNQDFLKKITEDLFEPKVPAGGSFTTNDLRTAFLNNDLYGFYKQFWNFEYFKNPMRGRYLEVLTSNDAAIRIPRLAKFLQKRKDFSIFAKNQLGLNAAARNSLKNKNHLYGAFSFEFDGQLISREFFAISGFKPTNSIPCLPNNCSHFPDNLINRDIVPNPNDCYANGTFDGTKRFFEPTGQDPVARQWDTEAKAIEGILEYIVTTKGISIPPNANKIDFIEQILDGTDLKITLKSEMDACPSCSDIIKEFDNNIFTPNNIDIEGGTKYYGQ